ncbi:putative transposase-like protein [Klebsiella pneumoniae subsp. rhinoscleromatis]|nr:putative transposase-like protein [Klebsiella pneumoniae subsp. rhinoscleromatis]
MSKPGCTIFFAILAWRTIANQKELFNVTPELAAHHLASLDQQPLTTKPKIDQLFHHQGLRDYLVKLFAIAGCEKWRHKEGFGCLVYSQGRIADGPGILRLVSIATKSLFSTRSRDCQIHMLLADELIMDYPDIVQWVTDHKGGFEKPIYKTALSHAQQIWFEGGFAPIFPDTCYHLTHYWPAAVDIPVASDNPVHYADAIRYNARTPLQGSLLPLTRLV